MITNAVEDWQENPIITTLDSIAAPISDVQFPTVTVCREQFSPPDNWAYVEKVLNAFAFECYKDAHDYNNEQKFPTCNDSQSLRDDFKQITRELVVYFKRMVLKNNNNAPGVIKAAVNDHTATTVKLIQQKEIHFSKLMSAFIEDFVVYSRLKQLLANLNPAYADPKSGTDGASKEFKKIVMAHIMTGALMTMTNNRMPFGSYLVNFLNLTGTATVDSNKIYESGQKDCDQYLNEHDIKFHDLLSELGHYIGFNASLNVSLFDVPSMVSLLPESDIDKPNYVQMFLYTQCKNFKKMGAYFGYDKCGDLWEGYFNGRDGYVNPCENENNPKEQRYCCNFWTREVLNNNLKSIMTVMRMADKRGQNIFYARRLLQPFFNQTIRC